MTLESDNHIVLILFFFLPNQSYLCLFSMEMETISKPTLIHSLREENKQATKNLNKAL